MTWDALDSMIHDWSGQRIATPDGAMLTDPEILGNADAFSPAWWAQRGELREVSAGRGSAWFVGAGAQRWVLRHYRRGGFIARLSTDRYVWTGERRVRAFAEWRLLEALVLRGLPVPVPVAARYQRRGLLYRCDLITRCVEGTQPLSKALEVSPISMKTWHGIGVTLARFHAAGVCHADLNAHNILIDTRGAATLIDFDRGRLLDPDSTGAPKGWRASNLARLHRSLVKIAHTLPADRFSATAWRELMMGYTRGV